LEIKQSGEPPYNFTLSTTAITSLDAGESAAFTIVPKTGLADGTHTAIITVTNNDKLSASLTVKFVVSNTEITITLNYEEIENGTPDVSSLGTPKISRSGTDTSNPPKKFTITVPGGFSYYLWEIDGTGTYAVYKEEGANKTSFTLDADNNYYNTPGGHTVRLTVTKNGIKYQVNIPFTIVN
jgi:hypothetical protein